MDSKEKRLHGEKLITPLHETLSEEGKKKLEDILTFWDALKEKWAEARKKFWSKYDRNQFLLQLRQAEKKREELIKENHQKLEEIWFFTRWKKKQEKFITEYLRDISRYGEIVEGDKQKYERITWEEVQESGFRDWVTLESNLNYIWAEWAKALSEMELKEWVTLYLGNNKIWAEWAKALSEMELKEWVTLDLGNNDIWDEWAKALSNMELKEWVTLNLRWNDIWAEWADALAKNLKLRDWVTLDLSNNKIWAEWAKALSKMELKEWVTLKLNENEIWDEWAEALSKMELKEWVTFDLRDNEIWVEWKKILENWVAGAKARGINCEVLF